MGANGGTVWAEIERGVARVRGEDALAFLHATTTQALDDLAAGASAPTCLLDDKAHVLAEVRVTALTREDVLVDGEVASVSAFVDRLARIAPLSGCEVADETSAWRAFAVRGPAAGAALGSVGAPPAQEGTATLAGDAVILRVAWGDEGWDVLAPAAAIVAIEAEQVDPAALRSRALAAGRPVYGVDVTAALLVNETPLLDRAVSFDKGCFPGQESVARIRNLGRVRRKLASLRVDGPPPSPGAAVVAGDADAGTVTSATATLDGSIAIALVTADLAAGAAVRVGEASAVVGDL